MPTKKPAKSSLVARFQAPAAIEPAEARTTAAARDDRPKKNLHIRLDVEEWVLLRNYATHREQTVQDLIVAYIRSLIHPAKE